MNGCSNQEKCVVVVDENGTNIKNVIVTFSALLQRNNKESGGFVTSYSPFFNTTIKTKKLNNKICFFNYKLKDSSFIYKKPIQWKIYNTRLEANFYSFSSIPSTIILKPKQLYKIEDNVSTK